MKILTANIALGLANMDRLCSALRGHAAFHGPTILRFLVYPKSLKEAQARQSPGRVRYLARHVDLRATVELLERENADVLILNEVLPQFHRDILEPLFARLGYTSVAWGESIHYPDATVSTIVASKIAGVAVPIDLSWESHAGGGAGIAAIRLTDQPVTVVGLHLGIADKFPWLYKVEMQMLAQWVAQEKADGREVIIAGDWNASSASMARHRPFARLGLMNADKDTPTCPTFLPWQKPLDHIFIPSGWTSSDLRAIPFGSDHLALSVEVAQGLLR